jgi:RNA polymerase-interacting CarD/CdnL/TRCF family regulator
MADLGFLDTAGSSRDQFGEYELSQLEEFLSRYADKFLKMAQRQLNRANKVNTGDLIDTASVNVESSSLGASMFIEMLSYYKYVDQGVRGTGPGNKNNRSPYKYKRKMPPLRVIEKWIVDNSLQGKQETQTRKLSKLQRKRKTVRAMAQKTSAKTLAFLIARKIKQRGLPYTGYFERSFAEAFRDLDKDLANMLQDSVASNFEILVKEIESGNNS